LDWLIAGVVVLVVVSCFKSQGNFLLKIILWPMIIVGWVVGLIVGSELKGPK
jgi:hypothetical protein